MHLAQVHPWWNWQTRKIQVLVPAMAWRFDSSRVHHFFCSDDYRDDPSRKEIRLTMNGFDLLAVIGLGWSARRGYRRGLSEELFRLLRLGLALLAGTGLYHGVAGGLAAITPLSEGLSQSIGFAGSTVGVWLLLSRLRRLLRRTVEDRVAAGWAQTGGAILATAKSLLAIVGIVATAYVGSGLPFREAIAENSWIGHAISRVLPQP